MFIISESVTKCKYTVQTKQYVGRFFKCHEIVFTDYVKGLLPVGEAYRSNQYETLILTILRLIYTSVNLAKYETFY